MNIPLYTLTGQIVSWLRALPKYSDIEKYVGKFPEEQLGSFYDSIEFSRQALMDDKLLAFESFSLQVWGTEVSEMDQYEQLQDLLSTSTPKKDELVSKYPALQVYAAPEFEAWCKLYLNRWYALAAFTCSREYLIESTYLISLRQTFTDLKGIETLRDEIQVILTSNAIQSAEGMISTEQLEVEKNILIKLQLFSKQSVEDFLKRELSRYEVFEKLFNVLAILVVTAELTVEDSKEALRRQLMTRSVRYLLSRCERERIRKISVFNKDILPWIRATWTEPNLKSGQSLILTRQYLDSLSHLQGAEFYPYIRAFIKNSLVLEVIFEPVSVLEVCNELKQVMNDELKFQSFTDLVIASRVEQKEECKAALQALRLLVQRFPMF